MAVVLEDYLFQKGKNVYYLGISTLARSFELEGIDETKKREEQIYRLGEIAHLFQDAGLILVATISDLEDYEIDILKTLNEPNEFLMVCVGNPTLNSHSVTLNIPIGDDLKTAANKVKQLLYEKEVLLEYYL